MTGEQEKIFKKIEKIHFDCHLLCMKALNKYLPIAGNVGIFTHSEEEYKSLNSISKNITKYSSNPNQKYYNLIEPFIISSKDKIPEAIYKYLYIRKPDPTLYGEYVGDIDFVMSDKEYNLFKKGLLSGKSINGVEVYNRPGWDMVKITDPKIESVAFIGTKEMTEKVRVNF